MKQYSKREFIKLTGLGTLGLFYSCYKIKNEDVIISEVNTNSLPKKDSLQSYTSPIEVQKSEEFSADDLILLEKDDSDYTVYRKTYNKRFNQFPKIIAICFTTKGVQQAIVKANKDGLKISVRSGGHSFEAFSGNNNGMVINLSNMKSIKWINDTEVSLQPACLLKEIYANFIPKNRILPAGSCGTVGIGGLTLGGGYGFFSRKYGLTCDHLLEATMVDCRGEIVKTKDNAELLWALKGGGNGNFGVITEMKFKTRPSPKAFSSYRFKFRNLTEERFLSITEEWFKVTQNFPEEAFGAFVLNGATLTVLFTSYGKSSLSLENEIVSLKPLSDEFKKWPNQEISKALKRYYGVETPLYFKNASAGMFKELSDIYGGLSEIFQKVQTHKGLIFQLNTLGGNINNTEHSGAYPHRKENYLGELQAYWEQPNQEQKLIKGFSEVQSILKNLGIRNHYRNYPDVNFTNWENSYYKENYSRLQKIKDLYDPNNLFSYAQSIRNS